MSLKKLDSDALRTFMLLAVLSLGTYVAFFRLGIGDWKVDETIYSRAGLLYVSANDFSINQEHPFLVKYILGVAQVMFGSEEAGAVRIPAATAALLTGLVLFAFARRVAGFWTGILALALWTISPLVFKFGRIATLEIFLAFFSTLALYLGWRWAETRSWWFAAFAGVALGLATASKIVGILFLPAILLVGLLKMGVSRRLFLQSMLVGLAVAATALATYAPLGREAPSAIQYMIDFQSAHNARGHGAEVNGVPYRVPPWWAHLWWQWKLYGTLATVSLGTAVVIALLRRRPLEIYLLSAALGPFLFLSFYSQVKLPHYLVAWQSPLILLLALTTEWLTQREIKVGILAGLLLAPFVYLGAETVKAVSQVQPSTYAAVVDHLEDTGRDQDRILVWGQRGIVGKYLPEAKTISNPNERGKGKIEAVIVDTRFARRSPNPSAERYLATHRDDFELTYTAVDKSEFQSRPNDIEVYTRKSDE